MQQENAHTANDQAPDLDPALRDLRDLVAWQKQLREMRAIATWIAQPDFRRRR